MNLNSIQIFVKSKVFLLLLVVGTIFVLVIFLLLPKKGTTFKTEDSGGPLTRTPPPKMQVLRVEPLPESKNVSASPTISITFKESIINKDLQVTSSPKVYFRSSLSSEGFVLTLTPRSGLKLSTKYTLGVKFEQVNIFTWSFTTGKKQVDIDVLKKIKGQLPYDGKSFRITYTEASDKFYVVIDAKPVETYKQAALSWFESQGLPEAESKINIFYYPVGDAIDPNY